MSDLTPRVFLTIPSEFQEPWADDAKGFELGVDAGIYSNAENSQLQYLSNGQVGWNAVGGSSPNVGLLYWSNTIYITGFSTPFRATIPGPASIELADGEVIFFVMPRLLARDTPVQIFRANQIFLQGTNLCDLRLFAARFGSTVYFYNGKSLKDGDNGLLFGGGLDNVSLYPAHNHLPALEISPSLGVSTLDAQITTPSLMFIYLYRNGQLQSPPDDYTLVPATGIITLSIPALANERFVILREQADTSHVFSTHAHLGMLVYRPVLPASILDALVTAPTLQGVDLYRNGALQVDPDDYVLDLTSGLLTLNVPSVAGESFQINRRINV